MSLLLLWPQEVWSISCPYGISLVFEYSVSYIQTLGWLAQGQEHPMICTDLEALRAKRVIHYLLRICQDPSSPLFQAIPPRQPSAPPGVQLPSIHMRPTLEVIEVAIEAILQIDQVIDLISLRCGHPYGNDAFKADISSVLQTLRIKQSRFEPGFQAIT